MAAWMGWIRGEGQRICSRRRSGIDRLILALEMLEPRHLLAADGFGLIDTLDAAWQPDVPVTEGPVALPATSDGTRLSRPQNCPPRADLPELIYLDQIAAELGEVVELEGDESLWHNNDWYDLGPA